MQKIKINDFIYEILRTYYGKFSVYIQNTNTMHYLQLIKKGVLNEGIFIVCMQNKFTTQNDNTSVSG